jgi:two-component system sensor histidine kinase KdpD
LARAAKRLADSLQGDWIALHVETARSLRAPQADRMRVVEHLRLAQQLGAETATVTGSRFVEEVIEFARSRGVTKIVVGKPTQSRLRDLFFGNLVDELIRNSADIDIYVIRGMEEKADQTATVRFGTATSPWRAYLSSAGVVALVTFVCGVLDAFNFKPVTLVMLYFLGVIYVASKARRGPAILASFLSVLCFDVFFIDPRYSLAVTDAEYLVTFAVMLVVALVISTLTVEVQLAVDAARLRERRTAALHGLSRMLASTRGSEALLEGAIKQIAAVFDCAVVAMLADARGKLVVRAGQASDFVLDPKELSVAQWVNDLGQIAGLGTDTLPMAKALYVPLLASRGPVGALGVRPRDPDLLLVPDQLLLLEAFANQTALALERDSLAEEAQMQSIAAQSEKLRGSLLSSVSHDLRTPLTSIGGAASSLLEQGDFLTPAEHRGLLETIRSEAERLTRQVSNLLEITRLEAGALTVKKELQPLDETLGAALHRLEPLLVGRPVSINIPADLPLVPADAVLLDQVFFNLVDNVLKHTPPDSPVDIQARATPEAVVVEIGDRGPGLPEGDRDKIFAKFYRGANTKPSQGTGLGLAICKGIITAHGGQIAAEPREGGGTLIRFTLPLPKLTSSDRSKSARLPVGT